MSYDVAFFSEKASCKYSEYAVYCRLRRGLHVDGLKKVPRKKATEILREMMSPCEEAKNGVEGRIGDTFVEAEVRDDAILVDFRHLDGNAVNSIQLALEPLGITPFDPQLHQGQDEEELYGMDYEDESEDPDPGYWVDCKPIANDSDSYRVEGFDALGVQAVGDVTCVFFETDNLSRDWAGIKTAIWNGNSFLPPSSLTGGSYTEGSSVIVLVCVSQEIVGKLAAGNNPRLHITVFTAFGDNDQVLEYQYWGPDDDGLCTSGFSLPSMPTRMKTILTTKYSVKARAIVYPMALAETTSQQSTAVA